MRDSWLRTLEAGEVLILDGGTGAELRRRGVPLHRDVWSGLAAVGHFDQLRDVHRDFIAAGAQVVTTNTFATSRFVLEAAGCGDHFATINRRAVEAAHVARDMSGAAVAIAGSISCLRPSFDVNAYPNAGSASAAYRELADLLADAVGVTKRDGSTRRERVISQPACQKRHHASSVRAQLTWSRRDCDIAPADRGDTARMTR